MTKRKVETTAKRVQTKSKGIKKVKKDIETNLDEALEKISIGNNLSQPIIDFLTRIIRGEPVEEKDSEMQSATLPQRITAAQTLLKLYQNKKQKKPADIAVATAGGIDMPQRSSSYDEWLSRVQKMNRCLSEEANS